MNGRLAKREFVAGARYSIADITALDRDRFLPPDKMPIPEASGIYDVGTIRFRRAPAPRPDSEKRHENEKAQMSDIRQTLDWLAGGALSGAQSQDVLAELCERLVGRGIPLWRVAVFVTTLHPDIMGRQFLWQADTGVTTSDALFDILETDDYRKSPFTTVYATRQPLRRRLADADCPVDFAILSDLRAEGVTDYAAFPLLFTDGTVHAATWSTQSPGWIHRQAVCRP